MAVTLKPNALITVDELQIFLQTTIADSDYANTLINLASDTIEKYTGRKFIKAVYTDDIYDGQSMQILYLKQAPIIASSVTVKDWDTYNNVADYTYTEHQDYLLYLNEGYIYKRGVWVGIHQLYRITYEAGYAIEDVPYDLKLACSKICEQVQNQTGKAGVGAETMGRYSVDYTGTSDSSSSKSPAGQAGLPVPPEVAGVLDSYKRYLHYEL